MRKKRASHVSRAPRTLSRGGRWGKPAVGFTLIEVLVALVIAALALGALTAAIGTGIGNADIADRYIEAVRRAQSHLDRLGVSEALVPGDRSGDDGGGFAWHTHIAPPAVHVPAPGATTPLPALYDIEIVMSWESGAGRRSVAIRSQRLGPPSPASGNGSGRG